MTPGSIQCTQEKTLFYSESKLGDLNANWIPILSVSIFASYNFTPFVFVPCKQGYIEFEHLKCSYFIGFSSDNQGFGGANNFILLHTVFQCNIYMFLMLEIFIRLK